MPAKKKQKRYSFTPHWYQQEAIEAFYNENRRMQVWNWCRRSGKDFTGLQIMVEEALNNPGRIFAYCFPFKATGRRIFWTGVDNEGEALRNYIPKEYLLPENEYPFLDKDMEVRFANGSIIRVLDFDDPNSAVGQNYSGVFFSEFALNLNGMEAWTRAFIPIFRMNKTYPCWAIFASTPRAATGKYFKQLYHTAEEDMQDPEGEWFCSTQTVDDIGLFTKKQIQKDMEKDRKRGMSETRILEEYYCEWDVPDDSSSFGHQLMVARKEGRITTQVPYDKTLPVHTVWDQGKDGTAVWFFQKLPNTIINLINFYEAKGIGLDITVPEVLQYSSQYSYTFGTHLAPHDFGSSLRSFTGVTLAGHASQYGIQFTVIRDKPDKEPQMDKARALFPRCYFHQDKCHIGLDHLNQYTGKHNVHSHAADSFMYLALGEYLLSNEWDEDNDERQHYAEMDFNVFNYT